MRVHTGLAAIAAITLASTAVAISPAQASDTAKVRTGQCSGATGWQVKAKPDDGRIEFEGEIDSNQNGQLWTWRIVHNGEVSARGSSTTKAPSGSFSVERRLVNLAGADTMSFRATNPDTNEVCRGSVTL